MLAEALSPEHATLPTYGDMRRLLPDGLLSVLHVCDLFAIAEKKEVAVQAGTFNARRRAHVWIFFLMGGSEAGLASPASMAASYDDTLMKAAQAGVQRVYHAQRSLAKNTPFVSRQSKLDALAKRMSATYFTHESFNSSSHPSASDCGCQT